jgi:pyruvate dehydrogenase E2 component (dihydrolipoamide acetyltransferase)
MTVDMSAAQRRRSELEGASLTDILIEDCAAALKAHPAVNAHFVDDGIVEWDSQHIGLAVATERGVVVPVIRNAGELRDAALVQERRRMVQIGRSGVLRPEDFAGGTFTISNLGMFGVDHFDAILNVPQVAILAVGAVQPRFLASDEGEPELRPCLTMTLTCDHRALDGAQAAAFVADLRARLEREA